MCLIPYNVFYNLCFSYTLKRLWETIFKMYTQNWPQGKTLPEKQYFTLRQYAMTPLCPQHHLSQDSGTTEHSTAKGEMKMFTSSILYINSIYVMNNPKKRTLGRKK